MPFCSWCRTIIQRNKVRWRCEICRTIFCSTCALDELKENCPFCKQRTLKREIPEI